MPALPCRLSLPPAAKCRLPAAVVRQLTGLHSLELHGACIDEEAARAAAALQQLTRLGFSVQGWSQAQQEAGQQQEGAAGRGHDGTADASRRRGGSGKCTAGSPSQRWQDHPIWGQLPLLSRLQQLAVGAELPGSGGTGGEEGAAPAGPGGAAVLPFDLLEGSVPDGIMDCRCDGLA